jgi:hypothetical protein
VPFDEGDEAVTIDGGPEPAHVHVLVGCKLPQGLEALVASVATIDPAEAGPAVIVHDDVVGERVREVAVVRIESGDECLAELHPRRRHGIDRDPARPRLTEHGRRGRRR